MGQKLNYRALTNKAMAMVLHYSYMYMYNTLSG